MARRSNPWPEVPAVAPFVAPEDAAYVDAYNTLPGLRKEHAIDTSLLPEPWLGSHRAPVVMLTANPGVSTGDRAFHEREEFAEANRENRCHKGGMPNYLLDPRWPTAPGAEWWRLRVFGLLRAEGVSDETLRHGVLVVEFHGYHSSSWAPLPVTLPSQWYAFALVDQAVRRGAVVVIARPARLWHVVIPDLRRYPERVFELRSTQNPRISPQNLGGQDRYEAVCRALASAG